LGDNELPPFRDDFGTVSRKFDLFRITDMLLATYSGALARPKNGMLNRSQIGPNRVLSAYSWVHLYSKGIVISTYDCAYRTYTIFEGTSEIQRLIIARAISGVHIR
jgi:hypothetical protein